MTIGENYPDGVNGSHPYFNPPACEYCGALLDEDGRCPECGNAEDGMYDCWRDYEVDAALDGWDGGDAS